MKLKFTLFPSKELSFELMDTQEETLERFNRRTEYSESLTSQRTDKSFRGVIKGNEFKVISSLLGIGAFCKLTGKIEEKTGTVRVEVHKTFRILLSIVYTLPLLALVSQIFSTSEEFSPVLIFIAPGQILLIRYFFVGFAFRYVSQMSLERLRDVLDVKMHSS